MPMNPGIKAQWTAALRSGEFEQGKGALNRYGKLCCLGVLCELAVKAEVIEAERHEHYVIYDGQADVPPVPVRAWAGLPVGGPHGGNPLVTVNDGEVSLAELNDGENGYDQHSFAQIADIIDAQL